ncbi:hypothetical protein J1605_009713 [Eschrichtius robustus]|uniref:Uncharacterized protein n=1 Tax=Eschrichtius robustus TaxID=9764 RepID=A0AB34GX97_ESCRO|nr:hypothetical protein J1605_009713 [Eschrichtius robustus]
MSLSSRSSVSERWPRQSQLQHVAYVALLRALVSECKRSWTKLYEGHFHLAVALQNLNLHKKAIQQLTNASRIASIPKALYWLLPLLISIHPHSLMSFKQVSLYESYNRKEANAYNSHMSGEMDPSPVEPPEQNPALAWVFVLS